MYNNNYKLIAGMFKQSFSGNIDNLNNKISSFANTPFTLSSLSNNAVTEIKKIDNKLKERIASEFNKKETVS